MPKSPDIAKSAGITRGAARSARFQTFRELSSSAGSADRLKRLRAELMRLGVAGLLLPRADIFQGEYLPASEDRLAWLTGFSGSAGFLIVTCEDAALFVDGRYTVQARMQVDEKAVTIVPLAEKTPEAWLAGNAKPGMRLGYDPALVTRRGLKRFETVASNAGASLVALQHDPVAAIWLDRPPAPASAVIDHPLEFAGESRENKLARLQAKLAEQRLDAVLVSECPSLNWLFNIRAGDVSHLPILRAFALVPREGHPTLVVEPDRLDAGLGNAVAAFATIMPPAAPPHDGAGEIEAMLIDLAKAGKRIRLDEDSAAIRFVQAVEMAGGAADLGPDPLALMKAQKNTTEIAGARAAHLRDGVAMARFLAWLDREADGGAITEIDAAIRLEDFRGQTGELRDISFGSISAAGPNAALPHYRVSEASNRTISGGLYLIDSGGQYRDGTTDITRTIAVGSPSRAMRAMFTRVLRGMIAISLCRFPKGTSGAQIDAFARQFLWEAGTDFDHGTGHGVGAFLSVHEGPQRISKFGTQALLPGMILSNEPGYYREGHFGIRIENLVVVEPREIAGAEREMLGFETLTFAPIDRNLIAKSMLTRAERRWLDAYHAQVLAKIGTALADDDRTFLIEACRPL